MTWVRRRQVGRWSPRSGTLLWSGRERAETQPLRVTPLEQAPRLGDRERNQARACKLRIANLTETTTHLRDCVRRTRCNHENGRVARAAASMPLSSNAQGEAPAGREGPETRPVTALFTFRPARAALTGGTIRPTWRRRTHVISPDGGAGTLGWWCRNSRMVVPKLSDRRTGTLGSWCRNSRIVVPKLSDRGAETLGSWCRKSRIVGGREGQEGGRSGSSSKQLVVPVWQAGPVWSTSSRTVSPSQSSRTSRTHCALPEVSPLTQYS